MQWQYNDLVQLSFDSVPRAPSLEPPQPDLDLVDAGERLAEVEVLALDDELALLACLGAVDLEGGDEPRERERGLRRREGRS